jgi:hypothetical protein
MQQRIIDMEIELDNHDRFRNTEIFEKIIKFSEEHGKKSFPNFSRDFWKIIYCLIINSGKNKSGFQRVYSLVKPNFFPVEYSSAKAARNLSSSLDRSEAMSIKL